MTISMYSASVPLFKRQLGALLAWMDKAEAHAIARQFDPNNYLQQRLAPDMLPFVSQVRIASDGAKACVARLAGMEPPKFEDNEATLAELRVRVQKTLDYIDSVAASAIDGSEERDPGGLVAQGEVEAVVPVDGVAGDGVEGSPDLVAWVLVHARQASGVGHVGRISGSGLL